MVGSQSIEDKEPGTMEDILGHSDVHSAKDAYFFCDICRIEFVDKRYLSLHM